MSEHRKFGPMHILSRCGTCAPASILTAAALAVLPSTVFAQPGNGQPVNDPFNPEEEELRVDVSEHMTVDLAVKDAELVDVLEMLALQSQKNIVASKNVTGQISANLFNVTFYQALDAILLVNGYAYKEEGNFIYVYTREELAQIEDMLRQRFSKVIKLNYLNSEDAAEFVRPLLSEDGGEIVSNPTTEGFQVGDSAPVGQDDYAMDAVIVIYDYEENILAIEELIAQIDTRPSQVLVEATILQTSLTEDNAFGIDFSIIADVDFTDFLQIGGPLGAAGALQQGGDGTSDGFSPGDNSGFAGTSSAGNTAGPATFRAGIVSNDIAIFMRALDEVTDTTILSRPKILTLNRQPARVLVGRRVGYLNTTSTETSTTQSVEFLDTGTQLYFRPFVSDDGLIRMELKPQVSEAEIRTVTDAGGAAVTIPDEVTQELTTNIQIGDGQTIVLGGLFREATRVTARQVPFLGDIPIVGAAFRGNEDQTTRSEIIFLITPSIISDTMLTDAGDRAMEDVERLRAGARQGLLWWSRDKQTGKLNIEAEQAWRDGEVEIALWKIQRSLALNPNQPEVYRLRERITGQKEIWPNRSIMDEIISGEAEARTSVRPTPNPAPGYDHPYGSAKVPGRPADGTWEPSSNAGEPGFNPAQPQGASFASSDRTRTPAGVQATYNAPEANGTDDSQPDDRSDRSSADASGDTNNTPNKTTLENQTGAGSVTGDLFDEYLRSQMHNAPEPGGFAQDEIEKEPADSAEPRGNTEPSEIAGVDEPLSSAAPFEGTPEGQDWVELDPTTGDVLAGGAPIESLRGGADQAEPAQPGQATTQTADQSARANAGQQGLAQATNPRMNPAESRTLTSAERFARAQQQPGHRLTNEPDQVASTQSTRATNDQTSADDANITKTQSWLMTMQNQIRLFEVINSGARPILGADTKNQGWGPLVLEGLIESLPTNHWVGGANANKVVPGTGPDKYFHGDYGWVYNPQTGDLWAAGFDAAGNPIDRSFTGAQFASTQQREDNGLAQHDEQHDELMSEMGVNGASWELWLGGVYPEDMIAAMREAAENQRRDEGENPTTITGVETD